MAKETVEVKNTTFYIGLKDYAISPCILGPILIGDTLLFDNYGSSEFTITGDIESEPLKYGQSWQFKVDKAKVYNITIKEFPNMQCTISVVKTLPKDHYRMY